MSLSLLGNSWISGWFSSGDSSKDELSDPRPTIDLSTRVAGVPMPGALLNTPNPEATTLDNLRTFDASPGTGAFTTRTACHNFVHDDRIHQWTPWQSKEDDAAPVNTINCLGYSSETLEYNIQAVQQVQALSQSGKPGILSITGTAQEVAEMLQQIAKHFRNQSNPILVEINLSCPNIRGKPPIAYDFDGMKKYLRTVFRNGTHGLKVGVKLTPYFYTQQFDQAAAVLNQCLPHLAFVTCINTVGSGLWIDVDTESPVLPATYGGLGGPAVHATALANVRQLRVRLDDSIDIIGVGGVDSGAAAFRHLLCGAAAVGVASAVLTEGPECFERIQEELVDLMQAKGYTSLEDFRGKLRDAS